MKRLITAVCCVCFMGAAGTAQTSRDKDKMSKEKMSKPMMVTGCVAAGSDGDHYMLTNGMMAGDTTGKSYDIMGGDLKAHVGHKVEITGMMDEGTMTKNKMKSKDKMDKDKMRMSDMHTALHVKSVKMIAATCP